jgi:uncharacterized protein (TIGR03435 family)
LGCHSGKRARASPHYSRTIGRDSAADNAIHGRCCETKKDLSWKALAVALAIISAAESILRGRSSMFRNAVALWLLIGAILSYCQTQAFEAADVKVNKSGETRLAVDLLPGGKLSMRNVPMRVLIMFAYHIRADAISGGPGWLGSDRFDVVAKASDAALPDDLRRMLRTLLAERFKLAVHTDERVMPAYVLVVGKSGPKLQPSEGALLREQRCSPGQGSTGQRHVECQHMTMAGLAEWLQELAPLDFPVPVVDQTSLNGTFDFNLDWTPTVRAAGAASADDSTARADETGPNIFDSVAIQLGLKLESKKLPLPIVVIDRVDRLPAEN